MVGKSLSQSLQTLISNSELGVRLALAFGRHILPGLGNPLVRFLADYISRQQGWGIVRGARLNQWVISGQGYSTQELDQAVQNTLRYQARALYDLYRYLSWPEKMFDRLVVPPEMLEIIENSHSPIPGQGKIVVGIHLSNFDFALHAIVQHGWRGMAITVANLPGGYQKQFNLRRDSGMELVTASVSSFRLAIDRLRAGGMVLTGIDRPLESPKHLPVFFGHPAPLPVHHIYLALKADVPIVLLATKLDPDGIYRLQASQPIYMESDPDHNQEIIRNAETVLSVAEQFIRQAPQQWAMFFPVWPDLVETQP